MLTIPRIKEIITPICQKYGVKAAYLFGSYARGEATEKSDVDLRIEPGNLRGMAFASLYVDMEDAIGFKVDILTTRQLPTAFLQHIKNEEILLYEQQNHAAA